MPADRSTEDDDARTAAERRLVKEASAALAVDPQVRMWPPTWAADGRYDYLYRSGSLLVRDADLQRTAEALRAIDPVEDTDEARDAHHRASLPVQGPLKGVSRFQVPVAPQRRTPGWLDRLEDRVGVGVADHEYVFGVTHWIVCPATEPEPVFAPAFQARPAAVAAALWPPAADAQAGSGARVSVLDTGLLAGVAAWAPWLDGVTAHSAADIEEPDTFDVQAKRAGRDGYADPYAGHGSFVAGVVRCVAPASDIVVERLIGASGFVTETAMITQLRQTLSESPDVISISAGGYTRHDLPPVGLHALYEQRLARQGGVVVVAAAGNNASPRPFWPAAFDWCVGVGSMSRDGQHRSWFSNYGSWVDTYAPGEDIVNAYPQLQYRTIVDGDVRDTSAGIVKWSGTSFATPIVSGLIAARMSRSGENGRQAAASVLAAARSQFRPGIGPRLFP